MRGGNDGAMQNIAKTLDTFLSKKQFSHKILIVTKTAMSH